MSFTDPTQETVVVVGGKYLAQLDMVLDTVDAIRQKTERFVSAVFLLTDDKFDVDLSKIKVYERVSRRGYGGTERCCKSEFGQ